MLLVGVCLPNAFFSGSAVQASRGLLVGLVVVDGRIIAGRGVFLLAL